MKRFLKFIFSFKVLVLIVLLVLFNRQSNMSAKIEELDARLPLLQCDLSKLKNTLSSKVVRIIGSFSEGTGFPLTKSEIITNYHVIEGEDSPKVVFPDGKIETPILVKGNKQEDIAILVLDRELEPFITVPPLSDDTFGFDVFAAGYPLGSSIAGDVTIVKGTYSGIRRTKDFDVGYIESSISVEEGMSGGPLVNACGHLFGITQSGITGTSYFLDINDVIRIKDTITSEEIEKVKLDLETPEGLIKAYYFYIGNRNLARAYGLLGQEKRSLIDIKDYKDGYQQTLQVELLMSKVDPQNENKVMIKLMTDDWVDGDLVTKYFEGYWIVKDKKLSESNIKEVTDPEFWWWYEWEKPEGW